MLFAWLTGRKITNVAGSTSNYFFAEHQRNDVEDFACLLLGMEGGLEATITVGRTGWSSHPSTIARVAASENSVGWRGCKPLRRQSVLRRSGETWSDSELRRTT